MKNKKSKLVLNVELSEIFLKQRKDIVEDLRPYYFEGQLIVTFKDKYEFTDEELRHFGGLEEIYYKYKENKKTNQSIWR